MNIPDIADIRMEDLLGRKSEISTSAPKESFCGKRVLVTGGGGSIGSEICRQIAECEPELLIIFDINENNVYSLLNELSVYETLQTEVVIGSVRDSKRVEQVFEQYRPHTVFHAAAHKHVPLMERSPGEAVKNNIFGTYNVAMASKKYGALSFMLISTDKAVNPTSVMGASKRVCEYIVSALARDGDTRFGCVRFGNVLGSSGSVIPLFLSQIKRGGPVRVTHSDIIRYFMTVPEAVALVLTAEGYARHGEIFVLDMGEPVRIDELARRLIILCGYKPDEDIEILYTGLREGEKLYEELLLSEEGLEETSEPLIFKGAAADMSYQRLMDMLCELEAVTDAPAHEIKAALKRAVPEYAEPEYDVK